MKNIILITIIFVELFSTISLAQNMETKGVQIQVSLKRGINVISTANILDFGEIVLSNTSLIINKSPQNGLKFKVISHPNKPVVINYDVVSLSISDNNLTTPGVLFVPKVYHTGMNSDFINPVEVLSGLYYLPQDHDSEGVLNLWIGGTLQINENCLQGDYTGVFLITIAY